MGLLQDYSKAMIAGDSDTCIRIEQKHEMFGLPPELVSIGLAAIDSGLDADAAIDEYIKNT